MQFLQTFFNHEFIQLLEVSDGTSGSGITAITKEVDVCFRDPGGLCRFEESQKMVDMRVHAPIRYLYEVEKEV